MNSVCLTLTCAHCYSMQCSIVVYITLRACARGKAIGLPGHLSVVIVVSVKARSCVLGICARCKHNQSVDIGENWFIHASYCSKRLISATNHVFSVSMPVVYQSHPQMWLCMLKLSVGKGRQIIKQLRSRVLLQSVRGMCSTSSNLGSESVHLLFNLQVASRWYTISCMDR